MKYFIDTEFLEGPQKEKFPISLFRKETPNTIDLISIGIVAEDGREYYAISKDFNLKEAWNRCDIKNEKGNYVWVGNPINGETIWVPDVKGIFTIRKKTYWIRENVLLPIWRDLFFKADDCFGLSNKQTEQFFNDVNAGGYDHYFSFKSFKFLIEKYGKTNNEIVKELELFCIYKTEIAGEENTLYMDAIVPKFYAYYADYDWVVFCWLFGRMIDLPNGFPMYCKDLKQMLDEMVDKHLPHTVWMNQKQGLEHFKTMTDYPKQDPSKSHNAIEDARWNKQLYEFLNSF